MFEPFSGPRVYSVAPGVDFPKALVDGILARARGWPPERLARVTILVNTRRMHRRLVHLFENEGPTLLPSIGLVSDPPFALGTAPPPVSALQRRLELARLIDRLLAAEPQIAPRPALFDLAESLRQLVTEMHDEAVSPETLLALDTSDTSGHWETTLKFINIVARFYGTNGSAPADAAAAQRLAVETLLHQWKAMPPTDPVIVAGSTGSRGTTAELMHGVARLPQGAVILPGLDDCAPSKVWEALSDPLAAEDHPQFRFARFLARAGVDPRKVPQWIPEQRPPSPDRNRLVSLALRPAPVTDQWMAEAGPLAKTAGSAFADVVILNAPSPRLEATAIAFALRRAVNQGKTAALITPDNTLARRVAAALDRWNIEPDASYGTPLAQTAPGRLLRQIARMIGREPAADGLVALLKNPVVASTGAERGDHLRAARSFEMEIRDSLTKGVSPDLLEMWRAKHPQSQNWLAWLQDILRSLQQASATSLRAMIDRHITIFEELARGPEGENAQTVWTTPAGEQALRLVQDLRAAASFDDEIAPSDYMRLFDSAMADYQVRDPVRPHPQVMIWGALEARVQGADLVILGGLNEGVWPPRHDADPWLNRELRAAAGMPLPDRRIGLSAHDFQQAVAAPEVILSRSLRSDDAETVPSRWLNRITSLLTGMDAEGQAALSEMVARGDRLLRLAQLLETPDEKHPPEPRPAPKPPLKARPRRYSVTELTQLIRDPYAIYAKKVLGLSPIGALNEQNDARLRGIVIHKVVEDFVASSPSGEDLPRAYDRFVAIANDVFQQDVRNPSMRTLWMARLKIAAQTFVPDELERRKRGTPLALERWGDMPIGVGNVRLTGKADRIDQTPRGSYMIYDYKTGTVPTSRQMEHFEKQLLVEALMAEQGAFEQIPPGTVEHVAYIGLGADTKTTDCPIKEGMTARIGDELRALIEAYSSPGQGFMSRRAVAKSLFEGDYDHLARFGEWDEADAPLAVDVGAGDG